MFFAKPKASAQAHPPPPPPPPGRLALFPAMPGSHYRLAACLSSCHLLSYVIRCSFKCQITRPSVFLYGYPCLPPIPLFHLGPTHICFNLRHKYISVVVISIIFIKNIIIVVVVVIIIVIIIIGRYFPYCCYGYFIRPAYTSSTQYLCLNVKRRGSILV